MSIHGVLGKTIGYPKYYSPDILYLISRQLGRDDIDIDPNKIAIGMDYWHCFEISYLGQNGIPRAAMIRLAVPANSDFIIESKSLKLYFNSLNFTQFSDEKLITTIQQDLSACVGCVVGVELFALDEGLSIDKPEGECLDMALAGEQIAITSKVDRGLLALSETTGEMCVYSHLLRSNCPVTNQPDWGTVQMYIQGRLPDRASLLRYILSYRQHNGFHEQCVERIFADIYNLCQPDKLMVRAFYTRRGGIDINPCRVSDMAILPRPIRLMRQ